MKPHGLEELKDTIFFTKIMQSIWLNFQKTSYFIFLFNALENNSLGHFLR